MAKRPQRVTGVRKIIHAARALLAPVATMQLLALCACAQPTGRPQSDSSDDKSSSGLGHYEIKPESLPPPYATEDATDPPNVVPRPSGAELHLPLGFEISTFAEDNFEMPRGLALAPNGDVFVTDSRAGRLIILRDKDGDGKPDERFVFAKGLNLPYGAAIWQDYVYVGNTDAVLRFKYKPGQTKAEGSPQKIAALPGKGYFQHWTRNVIFSPDGSKMYVSVGSESNVDVEDHPMRAAVSEFNPDGTGHRIYASGTRNPIGLAFYPGTRTLWAAVQERDRLGDDLVPDYVTAIKEGGFYGWPFSYIGAIEDPRRKGERPDLVQKAIVPDVLIQAHSAVLGLVFYDGTMFPEEYRGDAFVALHGSWNRNKRTGYKIICVRFKDGKPLGGYDDFVVGWMTDPGSRNVWGRPVGLLVLKDGSMLITDDGANKIWRVTYRPPGSPAGKQGNK